MKKAKTMEEALEKATLFVSHLPTQPVKWKLTGSWAAGHGRPGQSDIDVSAWFEGANEGILMEFYVKCQPAIDFHWYCQEWTVYQIDPGLWESQIGSTDTR